jgi:hypothetical protein
MVVPLDDRATVTVVVVVVVVAAGIAAIVTGIVAGYRYTRNWLDLGKPPDEGSRRTLDDQEPRLPH